ncbi:MAG TPA: acetate kinase, partial [Telluria sp.]
RVFDTSGHDIGDVELAARYQINDGGADKPYYIAGLRAKTRTGTDPFEVITDCSRRCIGENVTGTGLPLELPTGSGFYSLQPNLTFLLPADPAIFFGSVSYLHNFKRSNVERTVLNGEKEPLGEVKPGDVVGFNFGIGLALNDRTALSLGYDHQSVGRMRQRGVTVPGSVRTQLGTLLLGLSYRVSAKRTINLSVGAGVTRDTPDVALTLRLPMTF